MKVFADSSFLYNAYCEDQSFSALARRLMDDFSVNSSVAVFLEFKLGALRENKYAKGWAALQKAVENQRVKEVGVDWEKLFSEFIPAVLQFGKKSQPYLIDGLHVLAARQIGATHFFSFDHRSRQRAFARQIGLKVLPERLPGEF